MGEIFLNMTGNPEGVKTDKSWPHKNFKKGTINKSCQNIDNGKKYLQHKKLRC